MIRDAIYRLRNNIGKPLLILACRHHVIEVILLKYYWLAVTIDKTTGPDKALFKGLKSKWNDIDVKNCVITHFKWQSIYDSWFNEQAEKARKCLLMIANEGVFKKSQKHQKRADYQELAELALMFLELTFKPLNIRKPGASCLFYGKEYLLSKDHACS
nr:uncharacterized protein LOC124815254 [Hydra vulgaris]